MSVGPDENILLDVVEYDTLTGNERTCWQDQGLTPEAANAAIELRTKMIIGRYRYYTVPTGTGPAV